MSWPLFLQVIDELLELLIQVAIDWFCQSRVILNGLNDIEFNGGWSSSKSMCKNRGDEPAIICLVRGSRTEETCTKPVYPVKHLTQCMWDGRFPNSSHTYHPIYFFAIVIWSPILQICKNLDTCPFHAANCITIRWMSGCIGCHIVIELVNRTFG